MKHFLLKITFSLLCIATMQALFSQDPYTVRVNADGYKHIFEGAGASYGKWLDNHNKMSAEDQDKVMQWAGRDLNMQYLQDYVGSYPSQNPVYFDDRAEYFRAMRAYQPDLKMSVVFNNLPGRLCTTVITRDGVEAKALDHTRPSIYDEVADWYFKVLEGFYLRDVPVSILNIVNEPDHNKDGVKFYLYGHGRDPQKGIAYLLMEAVPRLKAMINNPAINTNGIPMPKIMAFSALSARRTPEWVDHFRDNYPAAWAQVDILSTHQYARGSVNAHFDQMRNRLGGREFIQSEMHAGRGDDLEYLEPIIGRGHYTAISAANLVICGVNGGLNSWWYFFVSASGPVDKKSALISMPWNNGAPSRSHQYYSFRQVTSLQPAFSNVMETQIDGNRNDDEVIVYRKKGDNHAYVTIVNYKDFSVPAEVIIQDGQGNVLPIKSIQRYATDAQYRADITDTKNYTDARNRYTFNMTPYSVNTIKVEFQQGGVADCEGTIGGTVGPGSPCDDGDRCTINDVYDNDCNCVGEPAYPEVQVSAQNEVCDAPGAISLNFEDVNYRTGIEFSIDGGNSYPLNVNDNAGTAVFDNVGAGTYAVFTRWGNNDCPVDLGEVTIEADPQPDVSVSITQPGQDNETGTITFSFEDTPRWRIEFSMDAANSFPLNVVDNTSSASFTDIVPGTYELWTRWGNDDCPVDLGNVTIEEGGIADCEGTIGGTVGPGSLCDDGDRCTINDVYDYDCNCVGEPAYPQAEVSAQGEICSEPGAISFTFEDVDYRSNIEFSYDGGNTYPLNVADGAGTATFNDVVSGTYAVFVRWGNNDCPVDLGEVTVPANPSPQVMVSTINPQNQNNEGQIVFTFDDVENRTNIEFSMNGGSSYPLNVRDNIGTASFDNVTPGTYDLWTRWGNNQCPVDLGQVSIEEGVITGIPQISGDECATPNQGKEYSLVNVAPEKVTNYSWWSSGAASTITVNETTPQKALFEFGEYFNGGEICVGVNLNEPPYYTSYCIDVDLCEGTNAKLAFLSMSGSVFPNPCTTGIVTVSVSPEAGEILQVVINDYLGNEQYQSTSIKQGDHLDVSSLPPGTYQLMIVAQHGTITKQLIIL